jgi:hypothetical protein
MEARLEASWLMSLESFKQQGESLRRASRVRASRREAAKSCLNYLIAQMTEVERNVVESQIISFIQPDQPMAIRYASLSHHHSCGPLGIRRLMMTCMRIAERRGPTS